MNHLWPEPLTEFGNCLPLAHVAAPSHAYGQDFDPAVAQCVNPRVRSGSVRYDRRDSHGVAALAVAERKGPDDTLDTSRRGGCYEVQNRERRAGITLRILHTT
jgi:hypothetical protein